MVSGKTKTGFEYTVDENIRDDWELVEDFAKGTAAGEVNAAMRILKADQYKKLKEHCRDKNGVVSFKKMDEEIGDILTNVSKNS